MLQIKVNYFIVIIIVVSIWYQSKLIIKYKIVKVLEFEQKKDRHFPEFFCCTLCTEKQHLLIQAVFLLTSTGTLKNSASNRGNQSVIKSNQCKRKWHLFVEECQSRKKEKRRLRRTLFLKKKKSKVLRLIDSKVVSSNLSAQKFKERQQSASFHVGFTLCGTISPLVLTRLCPPHSGAGFTNAFSSRGGSLIVLAPVDCQSVLCLLLCLVFNKI